MNTSTYDANMVHQEQSAVPHQTHPGHTTRHTNITPNISSFFHPHASSMPIPAHQQSTELQHSTITTGGNIDGQDATNSVPVVASHSAGGLFGPRQVQLTGALEKTFFNTAAGGMQTSGQRYYGGVPPTATTSTATNPVHHITPPQHHHHHQQGNTILITNNFSAHQYGGTNPHLSEASAQILPRATAGIVGGLSSAVTTANATYNSANAGNVRIITTLPSSLHQPQQQPQQNVYNIAKDVEPTLRDDIIQLPQFYHTPHQQSSAYAQHLSTMLPTHYTQQHFSTTAAAPTTLQLGQDDAQYFMSMTNDIEGGSAVAATASEILTAVPKLITTLTAEPATGTDAVTSSPAMINSPVTTTSSNSTLVLDRINICINNHYSDSVAAKTGLPTTILDSNGTTTTAAITPVSHAFAMSTDAPQQASPIIPAIHHKVILDAVGSGGSNGGLHTDPYASNDSTLVIDEPDSTTTTPHTPPTTPENSSPPPPLLNLISPRTNVVPQSNAVQNIIEDIGVDGKENYIAQTTSITSMKALLNKVPNKTTAIAAEQNIPTITQSIDLLDDDDESDYANSEAENDTDTGKSEITADAINESVMEIEDDDLEVSTPEMVRMKINTKPLGTVSPSLITSPAGLVFSDDLSGNIFVQETNLDSPPSPTPVKAVQTTIITNETASSVTLLTPPTPTTSSPSLPEVSKVANSPVTLPDISFSMGEDVFIRKDDGRQYLGTVIGSSAGGGMSEPQNVQYLIRFDDNSDLWCGIEGMRRLGSSGGNGNAQMCVACKRTQVENVVETCDDCRRGYHRSCTRETTPGSGVWWCLRCSKPMKDQPHIGGKILCRSLSQNNRSYKNSADVSKISTAAQKLKTPVDVYEFQIEDNEIYTSDDEIPIKHIMEKARKSRDPTQNINAVSIKPKSIKKHNSAEGTLCEEVTMCEKIAALDDENANDANSISKMLPQSHKKEKTNDKEVPNVVSSNSINYVDSLKLGSVSSDIAGKMSDSVLAPITVEHNRASSSVYNNESSVAMERSSRKRKAFTLSNSYKEVAAEAASKRYDSIRISDSSSDENSSSSRGTSLDVIIPPPKNFLGLNNPFRMVTPKKNSSATQTVGCFQSILNFNCNGTMIKSSIFNTTALDFSSKLAALKSAGIFPNLSTSNLAKAAGQPRTVRTIKRRLSAKDITIGPNQEVRRRRTRRLSSNIEIISTTTINPIPSNFFPIHAKDLFSTHTHLTTTTTTTTTTTPNNNRNMSAHNKQHQQQQRPPTAANVSASLISSSSTASSSPSGSVTSSVDSQVEVIAPIKPLHGRRLRQRPQKNSPASSRRSSISSASTGSSTNSSSNITLAALQQQQQALHTNSNKSATNMATNSASMQDLKQSVKEYFGGVMNRIESGEQFCIRAKRQLTNGQMQYLIEWGEVAALSLQAQTPLTSNTTPTSTAAMPED